MWAQQQNQVFWETSAGQKILTLDFIFRKISEAQRSFVDAAARRDIHVVCPPDCGSCCHGFMPDVLPIEAEYIAYFILKENMHAGITSSANTVSSASTEFSAFAAPEARLSRKASDSPSPCPFYEPNTPGANCRIYPARPLICRLFGYASTRAKSGETTFRFCRHMPTPDGLSERTLSARKLEHDIGATPPLMSDFSMELLAIGPSSAADRRPLSEAMPPALARISAILRYSSDKPEPEPNAA